MAEIAKIGRHTTVRGLARSLFDLSEDSGGLRDAEAALLAANPGLSDAKGFKAGAPVIVPNRAGKAAKADAATPAQVNEELARQLDALAKSAAEALAAEAIEAKESAEALRSAAVAGAVRKRFPDLVDQLPEIAKAAADRARDVDKRQEVLKAVFAQAQKDLAGFGKD